MTDPREQLQATSDALLQDLDLLERLELEKRSTATTDDRFTELAARVEELATRVLARTAVQRELATRAVEQAVASPAATTRPPSAILTDWREAERQAASLPPGPAQADARRRAEELREEYRVAFDRRLEASN